MLLTMYTTSLSIALSGSLSARRSFENVQQAMHITHLLPFDNDKGSEQRYRKGGGWGGEGAGGEGTDKGFFRSRLTERGLGGRRLRRVMNQA